MLAKKDLETCTVSSIFLDLAYTTSVSSESMVYHAITIKTPFLHFFNSNIKPFIKKKRFVEN